MFNLAKKTEINKMKSFVLAIAQFCAEMTIEKKLTFSQTKIILIFCFFRYSSIDK